MTDFQSKVHLEGVLCKKETAKAILVEVDGDEHWIPKSQVDDDSEVWKEGQEGTLVVSEWFAEQEGL